LRERALFPKPSLMYRGILAAREEGGKVILVKIGLPEPGEPVGREAYEELIRELERVREARR